MSINTIIIDIKNEQLRDIAILMKLEYISLIQDFLYYQYDFSINKQPIINQIRNKNMFPQTKYKNRQRDR